jgi:hypothetical protein
MEEKGLERRTCERFKIPGATVSYRKDRKIFGNEEFLEEFCPVLDMSRGGIRFLTHKPLDFQIRVYLSISVPGERIPLTLKGEVRWSSFNPGKSYEYQVGVQFNPYGEKKDQNYPGTLVKIIALEQKFLDETTAVKEDDTKKNKYSI